MSLGQQILTALTGYSTGEEALAIGLSFIPGAITAILRLALPIIAAILLVRVAKSLFAGKNEPETWAWLLLDNEVRLAVNHWENVIGRGGFSDILFNLPTISRSHAALIRDATDQWTLTDLANKQSIMVNGMVVKGSVVLAYGDVISLGGLEMILTPRTAEEIIHQKESRTKPGKNISPAKTLLWLTLFALLLAGELIVNLDKQHGTIIAAAFCWLLLLMWLVYLIFRSMRRTGFEIETLAFFLSTLGLAIAASSHPEALIKQSIALTVGLLGFLILGVLLRDLRLIKALRWPVAGAALLLLLFTYIFGETIYGARNWLMIGTFSFQPSELVKVAFIFAGAATLDRLFAKRNLYAFIVYSAAIIGALALMGDFGTGSIFFMGFLIIAFLRSGDLATIALSCAAAGFAGLLAFTAKPYIANRFAAWRHVWEYASTTGYQQTRTMMALASGGFLGLGAGNGWLKHIAAADTDLVFGMLSEE
ncbi:MAG: FtsW/RodA/SpoVE family cell cycle protein, partial [Clostridiales bacterium]